MEDDLKVLKRGSVKEILDWVDDDVGRASLAYESEEEREFPRKSLLVVLDEVLKRPLEEEALNGSSGNGEAPLRNDLSRSYEDPEEDLGGFTEIRMINRGKSFFVCGTCGYKMVSSERMKAHVEKHG